MDEIFDVITGRSYGIAHLRTKVISYRLLLDKQQVSVDLHVYYANHCYTRSRTAKDPEEAVLFREWKKDDTLDERVFCSQRYKFSLQLPRLIEDLSHAVCYRGNDNHVFYRLKSDPKARCSINGWYICGRLDSSARHQQLRLNIRSVHYRTNQPAGIRGTCRFFQILTPFYLIQKTKYGWL
nr:hypothetical protein [Luteibacter rhizovicinus]